MSWEEDFRRNIARTRQRIREIAPDMLDTRANRCFAALSPPQSAKREGTEARFLKQNVDPTVEPPGAPKDKTSKIDPLRPGPFPTCVSTPTLLEKLPVHVIAYAPGTQISPKVCTAATRDCPLVVLFHARGMGTTYLSYEKICRHLASYGFVVVSVEWQDAEEMASQGTLLQLILEWINSGHLGLVKVLSDRLVLIGHSFGGSIVDRSVAVGQIKNTGFKLSTVVLMSPSGVSAMSQTYTDTALDALLVLHDVRDGDSTANGGISGPVSPGAVVNSPILAYERAGYPNGGNINSANPQFPKHFAYAHVLVPASPETCPTPQTGTHYYQDSTFANGYIASFLLAYVRGYTAYKSFFRRQQSMTGIGSVAKIEGIPGIWHMHAEPSESALIDWASPMAMASVKGADEFGPTSLPQGDEYGLNQGQVFRVQFTRGTQCVVSISFAPTAKLKEYELISLGLCQSNVTGIDGLPSATGALFGSISLVSTQNKQMFSVKLHEIGGPLWYHGCLQGRTVCMEERVIPLSRVATAVKLESINQVVLQFDAFELLGQKAVVHIGNVKLIGKGP